MERGARWQSRTADPAPLISRTGQVDSAQDQDSSRLGLAAAESLEQPKSPAPSLAEASISNSCRVEVALPNPSGAGTSQGTSFNSIPWDLPNLRQPQHPHRGAWGSFGRRAIACQQPLAALLHAHKRNQLNIAPKVTSRASRTPRPGLPMLQGRRLGGTAENQATRTLH